MSKLTSSQSKWFTMPRVLTLSVAGFLSVSESVLMEQSCKTWYRVLHEDEKRWMREYERLYPVDASALVKRLSHGKDKLIAKQLIRANWTAKRYKEIKLDSLVSAQFDCTSFVQGTILYLLTTAKETSSLATLVSVDLEAKEPKAVLIANEIQRLFDIRDASSTHVAVGGAFLFNPHAAVVDLSNPKRSRTLRDSRILLDQNSKSGAAYVVFPSDYNVLVDKQETLIVHNSDGDTLVSVPCRCIKGDPYKLQWPFLYSLERSHNTFDGHSYTLFKYDLRGYINNTANSDPSASSTAVGVQQEQQTQQIQPVFERTLTKPTRFCWPHYNLLAAAADAPQKACTNIYDLNSGRLLRTLNLPFDALREADGTEPIGRYSEDEFWDFRTGRMIAKAIQAPHVHVEQARGLELFSSDCIVYRWKEQNDSGWGQRMQPADLDYHFHVYLFTDGVEDAVNKMRSARAKIMQQH